ncbi:MAG: hypothetical protein WC781_00365 [Candidatus Pacearchaeota archaeon]|jgi:hypothetical protein
MAKEKKIKDKKTNMLFITVIVAIVLLFGGFFLNNYLQKQGHENSILNYKKGFYTTVSCEYSCPLKMQNYQNKTQLLPDISCVKNCTEAFLSNPNQNFSRDELNKDNLISDMSSVVNNCQKESYDLKTLTINNSNFYHCSSEGLKALRAKYKYI